MKFFRMAIAILIVIMMSTVTISDRTYGANDTTDEAVLIDMGNGSTYWYDILTAGSCMDITEDAAEYNGLSIEISGYSVKTIGDMTAHSVGSQTCEWVFYIWNGTGWESSSASEYVDGSFAWGFYPDSSTVPVETPDCRTSWIMYRGDSSSSGTSDSYGTVSAVTPVEWYRTYTTGYVDSAIIVAGDYLYHTTGGTYGATGSDKNPWVYCINRLTGELVWEYTMAYGQGYEVTSPLVVGDMLIVTATNWNIYCFDRFDGTLLYTLTLEQRYPYDSNGDIVWDGRTFFTGATTPIYDSGAIYFGTADGHVMAYSISRDDGFTLLWDYNPDDSCSSDGVYTGVKGSFYFHAPVISEIDGKRMLFIGSYEGYVYAVDASTGEEIWVQSMIDLGAENIPHPGTPGSVASISVTSTGRLIIVCSDGGLSPQDGYVLCVDASTGKGPDGYDYYWKLNVLCGGPVVTEDGFYAYVQSSVEGDKVLTYADGTEEEIISAIYKFNLDGEVIWCSDECSLIKGAITLADGVIYTVDYSSGKFYPSGGGVTAISAEDGSEIWKIKLSPFSVDSYSMVSATVIEGKIYVGNDYGAIYCISDVAGPEYGDGGEIVLKNGLYHWSWILIIIAVAVCILFLYKYY